MTDERDPYCAGALAGVLVLDLTGPRGNFGAKLIAGLGADVIKVEPSSGDALRHMALFARNRTSAETSFSFIANNINSAASHWIWSPSRGTTYFGASQPGRMS